MLKDVSSFNLNRLTTYFSFFIDYKTNIRSQIVLDTSKYDCICAQPTSLDNGLQKYYIVLLKANFHKLTTNTVSSYFTQ